MATIPEMRIENAQILFRNFAGVEKKDIKTGKIVNREGDRNFCVQISEEDYNQLLANDWNVKHTKPNEEYEDILYYLPVTVRFDKYPPVIDMFTSKKRTRLTEDTVASLDPSTIIKNADIIINPSPWEVNGKSGIKAYLKKGYFVIEEDAWEEKYASWESPEE
jgi:hypothetical protein